MRELKTEHKQVEGTVPYKLTIRIDRKIHIKALGLYLRPHTAALALFVLGIVGYGLVRLIGGTVD